MTRLYHLAIAAILALPLAHAATAPGIFEVDLIFPRNDTYAPVPLMPVIFAFQNPTLAPPLGAVVSWTRYQYGDFDSGVGSQDIDLSNLNASSSDPYFLTSFDATISGIETTWVFTWSLTVGNCSHNGTQATWDNESRSIVFTTNQTSPAPDLEAATSGATCAKTEGRAFNVAAVEQVNDSEMFGYEQSSCAVFGPSPTTTNPCAVTVDSSAASSITAAISLAWCQETQFFNCTATPTSTKSEAGRVYIPTVAWALTALGLLVIRNN